MINLMPKSRKGSLVFVPTIVIMTFVLVAYAAVLFQTQAPVTKQTVGEIAANLIAAYNTGENFLFYSDKSAEYAAYDTIYGLASNGGAKEGSGCIKKDGYIIWHKNCQPSEETYTKAFESYFDELFKGYISALNNKISISHDYDFKMVDNSFTFKGMAKESFGIPVMNKVAVEEANAAEIPGMEKAEEIGTYEANSSFSLKIDYDFSDYGKIYYVMDAKVKNGCLLDPPDEDIAKCFSDELGMKWTVKEKKDNVVYIEVDTGKKIERFNKIDDSNVIIRFGVNLADWEKQEEVKF